MRKKQCQCELVSKLKERKGERRRVCVWGVEVKQCINSYLFTNTLPLSHSYIWFICFWTITSVIHHFNSVNQVVLPRYSSLIDTDAYELGCFCVLVFTL